MTELERLARIRHGHEVCAVLAVNGWRGEVEERADDVAVTVDINLRGVDIEVFVVADDDVRVLADVMAVRILAAVRGGIGVVG